MTVNLPSFRQQSLDFMVHQNHTMTITITNAANKMKNNVKFVPAMHISFRPNYISRISIYLATQNSYFQLVYTLFFATQVSLVEI